MERDSGDNYQYHGQHRDDCRRDRKASQVFARSQRDGRCEMVSSECATEFGNSMEAERTYRLMWKYGQTIWQHKMLRRTLEADEKFGTDGLMMLAKSERRKA